MCIPIKWTKVKLNIHHDYLRMKYDNGTAILRNGIHGNSDATRIADDMCDMWVYHASNN